MVDVFAGSCARPGLLRVRASGKRAAAWAEGGSGVTEDAVYVPSFFQAVDRPLVVEPTCVLFFLPCIGAIDVDKRGVADYR